MRSSRKRWKLLAVSAVLLMFISAISILNDVDESDAEIIELNTATMWNDTTSTYTFNVEDYLRIPAHSLSYNGTVANAYVIITDIPGLTTQYRTNGFPYRTVGTLTTFGTYPVTLYIGDSSNTEVYATKSLTFIVYGSAQNIYFSSDNANYGTVNISSTTSLQGSTITKNGNTVTVNGTTCTATAKTITGYTTQFSKWQYSTNNSTWSDLGNSLTISSNVWIKAVFTSTINSYTVTYKNGSSTIHTETVQYNKTITHTTHTISGKVFCGWYTDSNLTSSFNTSTKITANRTLFGYFSDPLAFTSSPVASATITYASGLGCVLFDALESQSAARVLWDFGDGTYGNEVVMYHHYEEPGTYSVLLSVYNSEGEMDTHTYDVIVYDTADGPPGNDNTLLIAGSIVAALVVGFIIARPF